MPVIGPEDLSPNDVARVMSGVLGQPIQFQQVPDEACEMTLMQCIVDVGAA